MDMSQVEHARKVFQTTLAEKRPGDKFEVKVYPNARSTPSSCFTERDETDRRGSHRRRLFMGSRSEETWRMPRRRSFKSRATLTLGSFYRRFSERTTPPPSILSSCLVAWPELYGCPTLTPFVIVPVQSVRETRCCTLLIARLSANPPPLRILPLPQTDRCSPAVNVDDQGRRTHKLAACLRTPRNTTRRAISDLLSTSSLSLLPTCLRRS